MKDSGNKLKSYGSCGDSLLIKLPESSLNNFTAQYAALSDEIKQKL